MIKQKWLFWRAGFNPTNQSKLKCFLKTLIGWKKVGPQKSSFCFDHVNTTGYIIILNTGPSPSRYCKCTVYREY